MVKMQSQSQEKCNRYAQVIPSRFLAKRFETGDPKWHFHENGVSSPYLFNNKISIFRVSKIRIGHPKDGWTGLWLKHRTPLKSIILLQVGVCIMIIMLHIVIYMEPTIHDDICIYQITYNLS